MSSMGLNAFDVLEVQHDLVELSLAVHKGDRTATLVGIYPTDDGVTVRSIDKPTLCPNDYGHPGCGCPLDFGQKTHFASFHFQT